MLIIVRACIDLWKKICIDIVIRNKKIKLSFLLLCPHWLCEHIEKELPWSIVVNLPWQLLFMSDQDNRRTQWINYRNWELNPRSCKTLLESALRCNKQRIPCQTFRVSLTFRIRVIVMERHDMNLNTNRYQYWTNISGNLRVE